MLPGLKNLRFGILLVVLSLILAACSNGTTNETATAGEETEVSTTKVIQDQFGEVTIPTEPKNMLVLDSIYAEFLIEMGVTPQMVAFVPEIEPDYRAPYFEEHGVQMVQSEQYQFNYEQLLGLAPDLIIMRGAGMEQAVYDELSKIAPTLAMDTNYEMNLAMPKLAAIFNKTEEANQLLVEFDEKAKLAREKIANGIGDKTVLVLRVESDRYRFMGPKAANSSVFFYDTLGLNSPEVIKDSDVWFNPFSLEFLSEMNPDYIFLEDRSLKGYDTKQSMENLKESIVWTNLDAVKNDRVYPLKTSDFTSGVGPIGSVKLMDYVVEKLVP
ncbi:ABC transporter substrate-binding protein [Paenibacillus sp. MER 99-2]|uniref:ABC transporter substrate-binding protein n=1 Tax=Paenibacillus sp. MER 99-2 TaxID=2939572 RepID=UPI0020402918|nr:ABC transporter substrate-binding protein [Paenibacillus sp. MER 99-2]MCM3170889.1 ABC transporter substrate-binding protein [Paenibacillus sp. MER 99-2]